MCVYHSDSSAAITNIIYPETVNSISFHLILILCDTHREREAMIQYCRILEPNIDLIICVLIQPNFDMGFDVNQLKTKKNSIFFN